MKMMKSWVVFLLGLTFALNMNAQQVQGFVHEQSKATDYVWPTDPLVLEKLDKWQDLKFGVWVFIRCQVSWNLGLSVRRT